ncbi:MAG: polymerase subunit sigma [Micavibrio sp.]|nr:polymerase subunit sigma [Micavibrio sp.]
MVLSAAPTAIPANTQQEPDFGALLLAVGQKQDRSAFIQLFNHYAPRIKSFLIKGGAKPEQAEELAQEAMMTVWSRAATYDPKQANAGTWIFTIARNKRIDALRKTGRMVVGIEDPAYIPDNAPHADSGILDSQRMAKIADAIRDLPPEQSDLIRKSFFEDKTHAQIAAEEKIPLGTVKSRLRLAMDRLRPKLGREYL